jgi:hypothetical protein
VGRAGYDRLDIPEITFTETRKARVFQNEWYDVPSIKYDIH